MKPSKFDNLHKDAYYRIMRNKKTLGDIHILITKFLGKLEVEYKMSEPQVIGIFKIIKDENDTDIENDLCYLTEKLEDIVIQEMTEDEVKVEVI